MYSMTISEHRLILNCFGRIRWAISTSALTMCKGIGDTGCCVVNCGEELFDKLVWELAVDIMEEVGHTIDPTEATLLERREIERRIHPYLEQLPTYQDRLQRVFTREKD